MVTSGRTSRGVVLATVLLVLLATTLLVHGGLLVARSSRRGADEAWEAIRVRRAVTGRVHRAASRGDTVGGGWVGAGPGVEVRIDVRSLSPEVRLVAGTGRGPGARWWAGRLFWRADPETRGRAVAAGVRFGGASVVGPSSRLSGSVAGCAADPGVPAVGSLPPGGLRIGPLDGPSVEALLPTWTPAGAPGSCPSAGCPPRAAVASTGRTVTGGLHTGFFWVRGDLVLSGDTHLRGLVVVEGDLALRDAARVEGAVDVAGDVTALGTGGVAADPCLVARVWSDGVVDAVGAVPLDGGAWPSWGPPP